jgi:hypothetical protein
MGWIVLTLLTAIAYVGSVGLAIETRPRGRAELWIAAGLFFSAIVGAPVLTLGYAGLLWPWSLAAASAVVSGVVIAVLARRRGLRASVEGCRDAVRDLAHLPTAAFAESWRARSLAFPGLIVSAAFIAAALVLTYLIEFCRWDDAIYHTPIVGWSIQNHGFAIVDFPKPGVGGTNGYPRLGEALCLWFVVFTDKSLIELPATLYAPLVMLVTYGLSRRFVARVSAMGLAVVLLLVPHSWRQFCSTYVDMEMAFFLLAATYYASRDEHRLSDTAMATLAMALAAATKTTWLMFVPPIALAVYVRRLLDRSDPARSRRDDLVAIALSMAGVALGGAPCIVRNWIHYGNPVWPVTYDIPALGIHWPGIFTPTDYRGHDPAVAEGFDVPKGGMHDVMHLGYGMAVMWVAGPLAAIAIGVWVLSLGRDLVAGRRAGDAVRSFAPILLPTLFWIATGPNFGQPRYNLHVIAAILVACAWLFRGSAEERLREGAIGAMLVLSVVPLFWMGDANPASIDEEVERLSRPFATRAFSEHASFDFLEKQKQAELGKGDEVVFSEGVAFPGLLWNFDFTNRVDYVPFTGDAAFEEKLDALGTKWVCVGAGSAARKALDGSGRWTLLGRTNPGVNEVSFHRKDAAPIGRPGSSAPK